MLVHVLIGSPGLNLGKAERLDEAKLAAQSPVPAKRGAQKQAAVLKKPAKKDDATAETAGLGTIKLNLCKAKSYIRQLIGKNGRMWSQ